MHLVLGHVARIWIQEGVRGRWVYAYRFEEGPWLGRFRSSQEADAALCFLFAALQHAHWAEG